jgi:hypothetical protein
MLSCILATVEQLDTLIKVNARGTFIGYKAAAKQMIKQGRGGRIIGSLYSFRPIYSFEPTCLQARALWQEREVRSRPPAD